MREIVGKLVGQIALVTCGFALVAGSTPAAELPRRVVLIGGVKSEKGAGLHDYPNGVRALRAILESSPDARERVEVVAYPDGWPLDAHALDNAATVVWYFDGERHHPLLDPAKRAAFEAAMRRGVGLVTLHQASTVPVDDDLGLARWTGAVRPGMFDRTTQWAELVPAAPTVAAARGVGAFAYRDEFYPTFRAAPADAGRLVPVLSAELQPQYRDGHAVLNDHAETTRVAWGFERAGGGRSFVYSGAHYLTALDQPEVRRMLLNAVFWTAGLDVPQAGVLSGVPTAAADLQRRAAGTAAEHSVATAGPHGAAAPVSGGRLARAAAAGGVGRSAGAVRGSGEGTMASAVQRPARVTFHVDAGRSGWRANESVLTPAALRKDFGAVWESPALDAFDGQPARLYASPLYLDQVAMTKGPHRGLDFNVVFAASSNGYVYAINAARKGDLAAGRILWRTRLGEPCRLQPAPLDGVPTGILSTPVIDVEHARLYVTHCDPKNRWQAYALDIGSGELLTGWPVRLDEETFNTLNTNAGPQRVPPKRKFDFRVQRGALNLSPDGSQLYVVFGETETGWLVSVDTQSPRVSGAFAAVAMPHRGSGGIWGAGGPAVDAQGSVYVVTGSGFEGYQNSDHDWTQSVLKLGHQRDRGLVLQGTYTPFNYCVTAKNDIDLGAGGAMLLPDARRGGLRLMAVGGKQGNVYLLDRDHLPGGLERRPACSTDATSDGSLLPPQPQPQFGTRGPLSVFGPYSEEDAALDLARARSVPAAYGDGRSDYLFVTGNTKQALGSSVSVPPSVVRLQVVRSGQTARARRGAQASRAERAREGTPYLRIDRVNKELVLGNPGSPVVTSHGARDAIVWILDENARRSALLSGADAPQPVLYALDAATLDVLWRSAPGELSTSGKYNEPAFGGGQVFVGTDRIQAFGSGGKPFVAPPRTAAPAQPVVTAAASGPATTTTDGATLYQQRCAACHDNAVGNIPPRALLKTRSHARILDALTAGVMKPMAQGLSAEQIESLARYLKQ